jgi:hypothetical protein
MFSVRSASEAKIEALIVSTQCNPLLKEFGVTGREHRKQNRGIGRNTLLLQMINPAPASNGPKCSVSSPAVAAVSADEH